MLYEKDFRIESSSVKSIQDILTAVRESFSNIGAAENLSYVGPCSCGGTCSGDCTSCTGGCSGHWTIG